MRCALAILSVSHVHVFSTFLTVLPIIGAKVRRPVAHCAIYSHVSVRWLSHNVISKGRLLEMTLLESARRKEGRESTDLLLSLP